MSNTRVKHIRPTYVPVKSMKSGMLQKGMLEILVLLRKLDVALPPYIVYVQSKDPTKSPFRIGSYL